MEKASDTYKSAVPKLFFFLLFSFRLMASTSKHLGIFKNIQIEDSHLQKVLLRRAEVWFWNLHLKHSDARLDLGADRR